MTTADLEPLYDRAIELHGHFCPGVILGVRMAAVGMAVLGVKPGERENGLTTIVETSRCATDAIQATTGCSLGRRTLVIREFGKMAATFSLEGSTEGVRVVALESSRDEADRRHPEIPQGRDRQMLAYRELPDESLFVIERVRLLEAPTGHGKVPRPKATCPGCGEVFEQSRGAVRVGQLVCAACAGEAYYEAASRLDAR